MDEALFARLARALGGEAVVMASISQTQGATPRKRGSRMLIARDWTAFSIGGGLAEARVIAAARELLAAQQDESRVDIDLGGGAGAAGICGGRMQLQLHRWSGAGDEQLALHIANDLRCGEHSELPALGSAATETLVPNARLLIVGAGHCGLALHAFAGGLDFDVAVYDSRADCFAGGAFAGAETRSGDVSQLQSLLDTRRAVYAVLLNRDFAADIAVLDAICQRPPQFIGMMGSARRIRQVTAALPQHAEVLARLQAPVGLAIGAQTPHEIAVSILAQLIHARAAAQAAG